MSASSAPLGMVTVLGPDWGANRMAKTTLKASPTLSSYHGPLGGPSTPLLTPERKQRRSHRNSKRPVSQDSSGSGDFTRSTPRHKRLSQETGLSINKVSCFGPSALRRVLRRSPSPRPYRRAIAAPNVLRLG